MLGTQVGESNAQADGVTLFCDLHPDDADVSSAVGKSRNPMKTIASILIAAACVTQAIAQTAKPTPAQSAEAFYRQGLAAEKAGDPDSARTAYTAALKTNPSHANARFRLGELKLHGASIAAKGREAKFGAVIIPEFKLDGATLQESLDALGIIVAKQSKEQVSPNFIVQDAQNQLSAAKITLNLKSMPARAVMQYLLDQSGAKARYDEHAIVIVPK